MCLKKIHKGFYSNRQGKWSITEFPLLPNFGLNSQFFKTIRSEPIFDGFGRTFVATAACTTGTKVTFLYLKRWHPIVWSLELLVLSHCYLLPGIYRVQSICHWQLFKTKSQTSVGQNINRTYLFDMFLLNFYLLLNIEITIWL